MARRIIGFDLVDPMTAFNVSPDLVCKGTGPLTKGVGGALSIQIKVQ